MKIIVSDLEEFCTHLNENVPIGDVGHEKHRSRLDRLCSRYPFLVVISPLPFAAPVYLSPNALEFSGLKPLDLKKLNMSSFTRVLHADHMHIIQQGIRHFTHHPDEYFINTYCVHSPRKGLCWVYGCSKTLLIKEGGNMKRLIISIFYEVEQLLKGQAKTSKDINELRAGFFKKLTAREKEIYQFVIEGHRTSEAAGLLHISIHTFQTHKKNLMKKLGVKRTADLIRLEVHGKVRGGVAL